jgi:hypothetical protein
MSFYRGVFSAIPSHPFDVIKTCMQGDLKKEKYGSFSATFKYLYNEVCIHFVGGAGFAHAAFVRAVSIDFSTAVCGELSTLSEQCT